MEDIFDEFERWRRKFFEKFFEENIPLRRVFPIRTFPVDISETEEEVIIRAEVLNFSKDELEIYVNEDSVEIIGRKKEVRKEINERILIAERATDYARRVIPLPTKVKPETAKAKYKNGLLEIRVEKLETRRGKKVDIE